MSEITVGGFVVLSPTPTPNQFLFIHNLQLYRIESIIDTKIGNIIKLRNIYIAHAVIWLLQTGTGISIYGMNFPTYIKFISEEDMVIQFNEHKLQYVDGHNMVLKLIIDQLPQKVIDSIVISKIKSKFKKLLNKTYKHEDHDIIITPSILYLTTYEYPNIYNYILVNLPTQFFIDLYDINPVTDYYPDYEIDDDTKYSFFFDMAIKLLENGHIKAFERIRGDLESISEDAFSDLIEFEDFDINQDLNKNTKEKIIKYIIDNEIFVSYHLFNIKDEDIVSIFQENGYGWQKIPLSVSMGGSSRLTRIDEKSLNDKLNELFGLDDATIPQEEDLMDDIKMLYRHITLFFEDENQVTEYIDYLKHRASEVEYNKVIEYIDTTPIYTMVKSANKR